MSDLKAELEAYASTDEPPVRLEFDKVLAAARRSRRGRRAVTVVTMAAVVAVVAGVIPSLVRPNSPPLPPPSVEVARPTPPSCMQNPTRWAKANCATEAVIYPELPPGSTVTSVNDRSNRTDMEVYYGIWEVTDSEGAGEVSVYTYSMPNRGGCVENCSQRRAPNGDIVYIRSRPSTGGLITYIVEGYHGGSNVTVTAKNFLQEPDPERPHLPIGVVKRSAPQLTIDQLIRIASNHKVAF